MPLTTIRYSFGGVTQRKTAKTFCTECGKKISRVVSRQYYENGLHNVEETRKKNWLEIDDEVAFLEKTGCICKNCEDVAEGLPVVIKKNKSDYEVFSRSKKPKRLGLIRRTDEWGSWVKWRIISPRKLQPYSNGAKRYNGFKTLADAKEYFVGKI